MFEGMEIKVFPDTNIQAYIKMINDEGYDAFYQNNKIYVGKQIKSDFAIDLSKARKKKNMSIQQMADKLQISYTTLLSYEKDKRTPGKYIMGKIKEFMEVI